MSVEYFMDENGISLQPSDLPSVLEITSNAVFPQRDIGLMETMEYTVSVGSSITRLMCLDDTSNDRSVPAYNLFIQ